MTNGNAPTSEHMTRFVRESHGSWGIFDAKYFHRPEMAPTSYFAGDTPVDRYCLGRVNDENARCCLVAFTPISEDRAREIGGPALPPRTCKQMAHAVLNALNNLQNTGSGPVRPLTLSALSLVHAAGAAPSSSALAGKD